MIGAMAGGIIGSPYTHQNLEDPSKFVGWNLFEEQRTIFFRNKSNSKDLKSPEEFKELPATMQKRYEFVERSYKPFRSGIFNDFTEVLPYVMNHSNRSIPSTLSDEFTSVVACGEYARTADEAVRLTSEIVKNNQMHSKAMSGACAGAHAIWMLSHGHSISDTKEVLMKNFDLRFPNESENSMLLKGQLRISHEGKLEIGDGNVNSDLSLVLPAVVGCIEKSGSWEEAVRRGVALGGNSSVVGMMTGALAEHVFGLPNEIRAKAVDYFKETEIDLIEAFEVNSKSAAERRSDKMIQDNSFHVIRQEGRNSIYVIPEGRSDIEEAARRVCRKVKRDFMMIRPNELQATLEKLSQQRDQSGRVLSGTYVENPRAEVCRLWLQDGKLNTSTTRSAIGEETLQPVAKRIVTMNIFEDLKNYAKDIRKELEQAAGYESDGRHIHFAQAYYPEVYSRSIDLMQGDILRGRIRLDDDGKIKVDTNISTGSNQGEYLEGVLNSMDIFHKNDGPAEIRQKLNEFCLDFGKIEDEDERIALMSDDSESESVKMKYRSNVDQAIIDMSKESELLEAMTPELTSKEMRRLETLNEEQRQSAEKYTGKSHDEVIGSRIHVGSVFTIGHSNYTSEEFIRQLKRYGIDTVVDIRSFPKSKNNPHFDADIIKESLDKTKIGYLFSGKELGGHTFRALDERCNLYCLEGPNREKEYRLFRNIDECRAFCQKVNKSASGDQKIETIEPIALKPLRANDKQGFETYKEDLERFLGSKDCTPELAVDIKVRCGNFLSFEESMERDAFKEKISEIRSLVRSGHRVALMDSSNEPNSSHRFSLVGYALAHPSDGRVKPLDVQHMTRKGTLLSQGYLENKLLKDLGLSDSPDGLKTAIRNKGISFITKTANDRQIKLKSNSPKFKK